MADAGKPSRGETGGPIRPGALTALLRELVLGPAAAGWELPIVQGETIGRFEIVRELGRGAFGVVYEARDGELRRSVAFKALRAGSGDAVWEQRALAEAEAAARLAHPNIVHLYDVGRCDRGPFLIMELLRGETLGERLGKGPLPVREAVRVATELARGVAHAHGQGVVHRDLKPGNVFLCEDGQVKVLDFGLAHVFGKGGLAGGTPSYMAPEQAAGEVGDERTDVYALGVILHELVAGTRPFEDGKAGLGEGQKPPELRGAPAALGKLVARMLARVPADRPASAVEVHAQLAAIQKTMEPKRLLWAVVAVAAAAVVGAGLFAWLWQRPLPPGPLLTAIADVDNRTGDSDLSAVSELLRIGLEQSSRLSVIGRVRLRNLLPGASARSDSIDEDLVRSAAQRAGADLVMIPRIRALTAGYDIEVRAERRATREPAFVLRETAPGKGALPDALDRLATRIRSELRENPGAASPRVRIEEAVSRSPEIWRHYADGRRLEGSGRIPEAVAAYQRVIAADPGFALAHSRLAALASAAFSGTTDWESRAHLDAALRNLHRLPRRDRLLVEAQAAASPHEKIELLDQVIAGWPQDPDAYVDAADAIMGWWGDLSVARPYIEKTLELAPLADHRAIDYLLLLARLDEALERARRWTDQAPGWLSYLNLAAVQRARGEAEGALAAARKSQSLGEGPPRQTVALAMVEGDAVDELERLCAEGPRLEAGSPARYIDSCMLLRGMRREALAAFDAARRPPASAPAGARGMYHAARAALLARIGAPDEGAVWREVEEQFRAGFGGIACMSWHLALAGDVAGAERVIGAYPDLDKRAGCLRFALAIRSWKRADPEAALLGLEGLESWGAAFTQGEILLDMGRHGQAIEALRRWRRSGGDALRYPRSLLMEALALEGLGQRDEALSVVRRLLRLWRAADPDLPDLVRAKALRARLAAAGAR